MEDVSIEDASETEIDLLSTENIRLNKIIDALTDRAERTENISQTDFGIFKSTIILEDQVRSRTSELLRVKEQFEQSELKLRNILEHAPIGMAITDISTRFKLVNQAFCDIVGYTKAELLRITPLDISLHEDREYSRNMLQQLIDGKVESYQIEKRYLRKDGSSVWVHLTTSLLCDAMGKPQNFIAQILDITARRRSDEQLRLAATVYHASSEAMMVTDANNYIIATNPAFSALTGYSEHEALGKNPRMLSSGLQDKMFYQRLWLAIDKNGHWEGEIWNRKISGEVYVEWLSINSIRDESGEVINYVALFSDVTEKKKAEEQVWRHANYDTLTQLPNRRLFNDRLDQGILKATRTSESLTLIFLDLDRFKEVNDTYGHQAGDQLLIEAARRISACVRESDTVARLGGDEFTIILFDAADTELTDRVTESLIASLAQPFLIMGKTVHVSASIGIARYPLDAPDKETLLKHADHAMYIAKNNGKNKYCYFQNQT